MIYGRYPGDTAYRHLFRFTGYAGPDPSADLGRTWWRLLYRWRM